MLSYVPRAINRWFVRNAQTYHRGVVSCGGCDFLCAGDILCQLRSVGEFFHLMGGVLLFCFSIFVHAVFNIFLFSSTVRVGVGIFALGKKC